MSPARSKLGSILLEHTKLTEEQLDEVLAIQRETGKRLGEILIDKNYLRPEEVMKALSLQLGIPFYAEIPVADIDPTLVADIPINYAKQHDIIPIARDEDGVTVVMSDPMKLNVIDDLRLILKARIKPALSSPTKIQDAINRVYEKKSENKITALEEDNLDELSIDLSEPIDLLDTTDEAPIIRLINQLLFRAVKEKASDIHIEPYERELSIRYRIDGILYEIYKPPKRFQNAISSRVKVMANLNIAEKRLPQDGRIRIKIAGKDIDIRVSVVPTSHGERVVMRLLDKTSVLLRLPDLGFGGETLKKIQSIIHKKHGIFLVCGPTGSGKSTTIYACLSEINSPELNIITVEDPVEYELRGIGQIQVNPKINLTFASGLRSILRQDPDIIMVGEVRDLETAEIAIQASLTGHLVFSTIHTNDAPGSITRLVDMGVEPFLVSSSILAVLGQRLIRLVCKDCAQSYTPSNADLLEISLKPEDVKGKTIYKAVGCPKCTNTGYKGRKAIHELMLISDDVRSLILQNMDANTIKKQAVKEGMKTIRDDGISRVLSGETTIDEVLRATQVDIL